MFGRLGSLWWEYSVGYHLERIFWWPPSRIKYVLWVWFYYIPRSFFVAKAPFLFEHMRESAKSYRTSKDCFPEKCPECGAEAPSPLDKEKPLFSQLLTNTYSRYNVSPVIWPHWPHRMRVDWCGRCAITKEVLRMDYFMKKISKASPFNGGEIPIASLTNETGDGP